MNGRLEYELQLEEKMKKKLQSLPFIFTEFYYYMKSNKSSNTIIRYIGYVEDFMNYVTHGRKSNEFYKGIKPSMIRQYMASLETKVNGDKVVRMGPEMQATRWSAISTFFKFLMMDDYINDNPMLKTERPKIKVQRTITFLKPEEINEVINQIEQLANPRLKNRDLCIISLALSTGLRISALSQINVEDIDFASNTIRVIEKGELYRDINIGTNMRALLLNWIKDRELYFSNEENGPLFISQHRKRLSKDAIRDLVEKYTQTLDKHIKVHDLRKSTATNLALQGIPIQTIQEILGHANLSTTRKYVDVANESKREAVNVLDNLI